MGLSRRGNGRGASETIWPGFVDAMTALLMVLMFVLTIFMVVQSVLRDTITTQDHELDALTEQVASLADALGLETLRADRLQTEVGRLGSDLTAAQAAGVEQAALIASLSGQIAARESELAAASARIVSFEAQVAALLAERDAAQGAVVTLTAERDAARDETAAVAAERDAAQGQAGVLAASLADLEAAQARLISEQEALQLALAKARSEIDAQAQAARLAAARREALDALIADLRNRATAGETSLAQALAQLAAADGEKAELAAQVTALATELSETEKARLAEQAAAEALRLRLAETSAGLSQEEATRLAEQAAAEALRAKLAASDAELTAMTLALEEQRKRAEETLTLLAAAQTKAARAATQAEEKAALLVAAQAALTAEQAQSVEAARRVALLNEQIAALRGQLGALQGLLDAAEAKDVDAKVQLEALGNRLNSALAQVAAEQKRRAELEAAEAARLLAEVQDLTKFRSEFFGQLRRVLAGREGVRIVGDRFVFSSEVLFTPGSADLASEGKAQIAGVVATLNDIAEQIPPGIDWIIRVDGHTDNVPLSGEGEFADNWELSQARALSVVRYMQDGLGFPPTRLAATGFGEYWPVVVGDSPNARAQNRRIELKLTER
ncbi:MAG: peptidoglycan -binding protein [Pseudorhodobacter sp.]|nr:peptidoglycan -binding protein [Pseudorhodobacter sp.]